MIKVKISKMKNFAISSKPASFDITLKNNNYIMKGEILVDFTKKTMRVYLDKALDYYEQLAVLKAIFYSFCITEVKKTKNKISEHIEEYKFIDVQKSEDRKTIIEYLLEYDINDFNEYKRKEKIISQIKKSYDKISNGVKECKIEIKLDPISDFSYKEKNVYRSILQKYLKRKKYNGKLEDISHQYNNEFKFDYPNYYNFNLFYVLRYVNIEK